MNRLNNHKTVYNYLFVILMIIFYFTEGVSKYYNYYDLNKLYLTRSIKSVVLIILISYLFHKKKWLKIRNLSILVIVFFIGQLFLQNTFITYKNILILTKYIFPIILLESSFLYFDERKRKLFFKYFEYVLILNSILIIIGFFFDIFLLKTYGKRFGYNGLFSSSSTSTYFYIVAIFYLYRIQNKSKYFWFLSLFGLTSMLLVGTKSIFIFSILLLIYVSIFKMDKQKKMISFLTTTTISIFLFFYFILLDSTFITIFTKKGLLTSILSYRDILLSNETIPFINENWSLVNYIFGGIGKTINRSQLGFIDLFLTFGFVGSILYLITYFNSLIKVKITKDVFFILIALSIIIALGGNYFYNATIAIYLVVIQQILIHKTNE